jgi:hypothetical protein
MKKEKPKFKIGDRCVFVDEVVDILSVLDNNMTIKSKPFWYEGKANECPEDFLRLYNGQKVGDLVKE